MTVTVSDLLEGSLVNGRSHQGGGATRPVQDPATGDTIATVTDATAEVISEALTVAELAQPGWAATTGAERAALLQAGAALAAAHVEEISWLLTAEQGKPLAEARAEVAAAVDQLQWNAEEARRLYGRIVPGRRRHERMIVEPRPVGPTAVLVPWNFPLLLAARKLAPALAAGCVVIWKPAPETPFSSLRVAQLLLDAGIPPGVLGVLVGDPATISDALIASPVIRKVSCTGSVAIGRDVARRAAHDIKRVSLELGGHAPVIVLSDLDPMAAAAEVAQSKYRNAGQVCVAPSRVYVDQVVYREFVDALTDRALALRVGSGHDPATEMGPLTTSRRVAAVGDLVQQAVRAGASLTAGGRAPEHVDPAGFWYAPTVLSEVPAEASILRDEPFGPVVTVSAYRDIEQAVTAANDTRYGLAGYILGADLDRARRVAERLDVGMIGINTMLISRAEAPFGGVKDSGIGREGGSEGINEYVTTRSMLMQTPTSVVMPAHESHHPRSQRYAGAVPAVRPSPVPRAPIVGGA